MQGMLNDVGLNLKIEVLEFGALIEKTTNKQHDMAFFGWVTSTSDADYTYYPLFHSSMHGAPGNRSFYNNPEIDSLIEAGRSNPNYEERKEIYKKIAVILADEVPSLPIFFQNMSVGINKKVEGFTINPIGYHKLQNVKVYK
jgi:peptide/nickel transport system substrate-binding protein